MGRIVQVLVDNDGKTSTGVARTDNEGAPVAGIDQVLAYTYNVKGEQTALLRDNNVDGKYDYREAYTLDANGRQVQKEIDLTNDGTFDRKEVYTKEADDGLVKTEFYNLVEGREVLTKVEDYTLNTNNQRTSVKVDTLGDGTINSITRYDLDALGRVAKAYFDTDGDEKVDRIEHYTRDANGHVIKTDFDADSDGKIDSNRTYERNALGYLIQQNSDDDNDGIVDAKALYTYDVYGNRTRTMNDTNADGIPNRIIEYKYNEIGQVIEEYNDRLGDGLTNDDAIYRYEYDLVGNRIKTDSLNALTGKLNNTSYAEYDNTGFQFRSSQDSDGDGIISSAADRIFEFTPDPVWGSKLTETVYRGTGQLIHKDVLERNSNGVIILNYRDNLNDGTIDMLEFGHYTGNYTTSHTEDFTNTVRWDAAKLEYIKGVDFIRLSSAVADTTVILDSDTVAKIMPKNNGIRIVNGDSNDTVSLQGFTQSEKSSRTGHNQYTADVDGTTYTIWVNEETSVTLG